jgi:hypothetical protein
LCCGNRIFAYLETADKAVGNVILKEMSSLVVNAGPTPHILVVVLSFALVEDGCTNTPHDNAEDEESNSKDSVVRGNLFGSMMTSSPVGDNDKDGHDQGNTGDGEQKDLRPDFGVVGPWWEAVSWCETLCGVEDGESTCDHGKNDERAGKVDAS